jgi:hypothetical protein
LPSHMRHMTSVPTFKKCLKTYLFEIAFNWLLHFKFYPVLLLRYICFSLNYLLYSAFVYYYRKCTRNM